MRRGNDRSLVAAVILWLLVVAVATGLLWMGPSLAPRYTSGAGWGMDVCLVRGELRITYC